MSGISSAHRSDAGGSGVQDAGQRSIADSLSVVICTHYYQPHVGGIEIVVENHAQRLADRGHDVTVVTTAIDAPPGRTKRDGYDVVRYDARNPLEERGLPYPLPNPLACRRAVNSTIDETVDVLHVHGMNYLTSLLPVLTAPTDDIPVIVHQHTPFVDYNPVLNVVEHTNDRLVGGAVLRYADRAIGVSENVSAYLAAQYRGSVTTLFNGVDTDRFHPDVTPTERELLYVGRLTQKKGIDRLLEAAARLDERTTSLTVRIVGDGPMAESVQSAAQRLSHLEYEGFVDADRLPALYSRARALVVPALDGDAFPTLTILEALSSGTPAVLPPVTQSAPGFAADETYVQTPPTAPGLAETIAALDGRQPTLDRIADAARELAVETYDWDRRVDDIEEIYVDLCRAEHR